MTCREGDGVRIAGMPMSHTWDQSVAKLPAYGFRHKPLHASGFQRKTTWTLAGAYALPSSIDATGAQNGNASICATSIAQIETEFVEMCTQPGNLFGQRPYICPAECKEPP